MYEQLRNNICEVTFTKNNGDERTMICTLMPDFLPDVENKDKFDPKPTGDLITVWDIESNAWRSFKPSRVKKIEFSPE